MRARWMTVALCAGLAACGSEPANEQPRAEPERAEPMRAEPMRAVAGGVTWEAPDPLVYRRPANEMRAAEYGVRGHKDATLAVFFFGEDQGGSVESNIDRWLGQLRQPDGTPTSDVALRDEREVNGLRVSTVDARGTFVGRLGMGGGGEHPGWRVLGAIVDGPRGLVFFKLTGPEAAVGAAQDAFARLLESLQPM